ncbi:hypothetical protein C2845_PM01G39440 [Panicum miliaceum]|uniref:Xylanase inhibitor C-terminal domain-containing protein n=1 Tax=Panicum miliaceum TaxID=4540 RepID=A0A3L6TMU0_PANMI|nr:hypothetical protein C2845_PM01G39440 [Panicum miliaceum]
MADLGYKEAHATSFLDTCYDLTGVQGKELPAVSLAFQGGASWTWMRPGSCSWWTCRGRAWGSRPTTTILTWPSLGTRSRRYGVLHDLGKKLVGFAPGAC